MSNLIPADKLIKLVKEWRNKQMGFAWDAVNKVLKIITSLQQEQPEVDLEKEIEQYTIGFIGELKCYKDWTPRIARFARYFYDLGFNARKEE